MSSFMSDESASFASPGPAALGARSSSAPADAEPYLSSEEQSVLALKDAVAQTLETQGVLGAIRAQLRAAVYTAIDTQEREQGIHLENIKVRAPECPA